MIAGCPHPAAAVFLRWGAGNRRPAAAGPVRAAPRKISVLVLPRAADLSTDRGSNRRAMERGAGYRHACDTSLLLSHDGDGKRGAGRDEIGTFRVMVVPVADHGGHRTDGRDGATFA